MLLDTYKVGDALIINFKWYSIQSIEHITAGEMVYLGKNPPYKINMKEISIWVSDQDGEEIEFIPGMEDHHERCLSEMSGYENFSQKTLF